MANALSSATGASKAPAQKTADQNKEAAKPKKAKEKEKAKAKAPAQANGQGQAAPQQPQTQRSTPTPQPTRPAPPVQTQGSGQRTSVPSTGGRAGTAGRTPGTPTPAPTSPGQITRPTTKATPTPTQTTRTPTPTTRTPQPTRTPNAQVTAPPTAPNPNQTPSPRPGSTPSLIPLPTPTVGPQTAPTSSPVKKAQSPSAQVTTPPTAPNPNQTPSPRPGSAPPTLIPLPTPTVGPQTQTAPTSPTGQKTQSPSGQVTIPPAAPDPNNKTPSQPSGTTPTTFDPFRNLKVGPRIVPASAEQKRIVELAEETQHMDRAFDRIVAPGAPERLAKRIKTTERRENELEKYLQTHEGMFAPGLQNQIEDLRVKRARAIEDIGLGEIVRKAREDALKPRPPAESEAAQHRATQLENDVRAYMAQRHVDDTKQRAARVLRESLSDKEQKALSKLEENLVNAKAAERQNPAHPDAGRRVAQAEKQYEKKFASSFTREQLRRYEAETHQAEVATKAKGVLDDEAQSSKAYFDALELEKQPDKGASKNFTGGDLNLAHQQFEKSGHDRKTREIALRDRDRAKAGDPNAYAELSRAMNEGKKRQEQIDKTRLETLAVQPPRVDTHPTAVPSIQSPQPSVDASGSTQPQTTPSVGTSALTPTPQPSVGASGSTQPQPSPSVGTSALTPTPQPSAGASGSVQPQPSPSIGTSASSNPQSSASTGASAPIQPQPGALIGYVPPTQTSAPIPTTGGPPLPPTQAQTSPSQSTSNGVTSPIQTPKYSYDPQFDMKNSPDKALRAELAARLLGGPVNGKVHLSLEEQFKTNTNQLAARLSNGNPIAQSVYANLYGGKDPLGGGPDKAPLWERMKISREDLRKTLTEEPWKVASHHLQRTVTPQDYDKLQKLNGPIGHLLNVGAHPNTALTLQASWTAHFYGGTDPVTQAQLKPVWERWGMSSPQQLAAVVNNHAPGSVAGAAALPRLIGGRDPKTGNILPQPWTESPRDYGAESLRKAQDILKVKVAEVPRNAVPPELAEQYALGLTSNADYQTFQYQTPLALAQSPQIRNGPERTFQSDKRKDKFASALISDPLGGAGLFGLWAGGRKPPATGASDTGGAQSSGTNTNAPDQSAGKQSGGANGELVPHPPKYQAHWVAQVFPNGGQESMALFKLQQLPRFDEKQLADLKSTVFEQQKAQLEKQAKGSGKSRSAEDIEREANRYAQGVIDDKLASKFVKPLGSWTDNGASFGLYFGKGDETENSRGRRPGAVTGDYGLASDGSLEQFGVGGAGPLPGKSKWHAEGAQVQFTKDESGNFAFSGVGPVNEWGKGRIQLSPMLLMDPDTHAVNGASFMGGTGHHLAELSWQQNVGKPSAAINPNPASLSSNGLGPHVVYTDPSANTFNIGFMGGKNGKSVGAAWERVDQSTTEAYVSLDPSLGGTAAKVATDQAKSLYNQSNRNNAPGALDLKVGTGISNSQLNKDTLRVNAFYSVVNAGVSAGGGIRTTSQVSRTAPDTWQVSRYEGHQKEYSGTVGIWGVGPGGKSWNDRQQGETFSVKGTTAAHGGKVTLDPQAQATLDRYVKEGVFPNVENLQNHFNGEKGKQYADLRDSFVDAGKKLTEAQTALQQASTLLKASTGTPDEVRELQDQKLDAARLLSAAQSSYVESRERINHFARSELKPGDEVMPGVKLQSSTTRRTDGSSSSLGWFEMNRRELVNTQQRFEDGTRTDISLTRDRLSMPEINERLGISSGKGTDLYTLSTQSRVVRGGPADGPMPSGLSYDLARSVRNLGDTSLLDAVGAGRNIGVDGRLSLDVSSKQLRAIGESLNAPTAENKQKRDALWDSMSRRASEALKPREWGGNFLATNPEYADNVPLHWQHVGMKNDATDMLKRSGVPLTPDLIKEFANVKSPEALAALDERKRGLFVDAVLSTSSADHTPYEALAVLGAKGSTIPAVSPAPLFSDKQLEQGFKATVRRFENLKFTSNNLKEFYRKVAPQVVVKNPRDDARIFQDPASEFVRFLRDSAPNSKVRTDVLGQATFQGALPTRVAAELKKPSETLKKELAELGVSPRHAPGVRLYLPGAAKPMPTADSPSKLVAYAMKESPAAAWQALEDQRIELRQVFDRLHNSDDDQVLRRALVDMLTPSAPDANLRKLLDEQRQLAERLGW